MNHMHQVIISQLTDQNESNKNLNLRHLKKKTLKYAVINGISTDKKRAEPAILPNWNIQDDYLSTQN